MILKLAYIKVLVIILLVSGIIQKGYSQSAYNLVPNYSFELFNVSCSNIGQSLSPEATNWYSPINNPKSIYSYYNYCATQTCCGVPYNTVGYSYQYAHTGNAYVGINSLATYGYNLRHYIQNKLMDSLKANHCYYIEFYINKHDAWIYATNNMGLLIGDTAILSNKNIYTPASPQIQLYGNSIITDTMNWIKVGGVYIAHGGEKYITIGNFKDDAHTDTLRYIQSGNNGGGYYIDDVSVIPLDSMQLKAEAGRDTTIVKGDSVWIGSRLCGLTNVVWYDAANNVIDTGAPGIWVKPMSNTFYVIEQNVCGQYSRDTVNITVASLPVIIKNYELKINNKIQGEGIENIWTTSTEINVSHFNVQWSLDGVMFETVGTVKAKGAGKYSYTAPPHPEPLSPKGVLFFRLEVVDRNGALSYSEIKQLTIDNGGLIISPNPATDFLTISGGTITAVRICDVSGRVLILGKEKKVDVRGLVSGVYYVEIETLNGDHVTRKFIKLP